MTERDDGTCKPNDTNVATMRATRSKGLGRQIPAIEFAMNLARSETTGFSLERRGRCQCMNNSEFPGVSTFAVRMEDALTKAHDTIIATRVRHIELLRHASNVDRRTSQL